MRIFCCIASMLLLILSLPFDGFSENVHVLFVLSVPLRVNTSSAVHGPLLRPPLFSMSLTIMTTFCHFLFVFLARIIWIGKEWTSNRVLGEYLPSPPSNLLELSLPAKGKWGLFSPWENWKRRKLLCSNVASIVHQDTPLTDYGKARGRT